MNQYQFEQIIRRTTKRFGKIPKGGEDAYTIFFYTVESNLLKVNRAHPECDGRRLLEAFQLALCEMEDRLEDRHSDTSAFENPENLLLKHAVLMAFDPFTNEEVNAIVRDTCDTDILDRDTLNRIYETPAQILVRLWDFVLARTEKQGPNGYFIFLEGLIGSQVDDDDKMHFISPVLSQDMDLPLT